MTGHSLYEDDVIQLGFYFIGVCECGKRLQRTSLSAVMEAHRGHVHVEEARAALAEGEKGDAG